MIVHLYKYWEKASTGYPRHEKLVRPIDLMYIGWILKSDAVGRNATTDNRSGTKNYIVANAHSSLVRQMVEHVTPCRHKAHVCYSFFERELLNQRPLMTTS